MTEQKVPGEAEAALEAFVASAREAGTPRALWEATVDWLNGQGVRTVAYHHFVGSLSTDPTPLIVMDGFSEDAVARYVGAALYRLNPVPDLVIGSADPVFWSDLPGLEQILDAVPDFAAGLKEAGVDEGVSVQVFGPRRRNGVFGLGFAGERPALGPAWARAVQLACQFAHLTYCRMSEEPTGARPEISPREREVLELIAQGKSNGVIGDILGISRHTVDTHVRRLFQKLGVSDRTTAAIRGLGAGLVQPVADAA